MVESFQLWVLANTAFLYPAGSYLICQPTLFLFGHCACFLIAGCSSSTAFWWWSGCWPLYAKGLQNFCWVHMIGRVFLLETQQRLATFTTTKRNIFQCVCTELGVDDHFDLLMSDESCECSHPPDNTPQYNTQKKFYLEDWSAFTIILKKQILSFLFLLNKLNSKLPVQQHLKADHFTE